MADPPRPDVRVVAAYLDEVDVELVKAVRLSRGLRVTADHNLEGLVHELAADDPWQQKLRVIEPLSPYATTYRYPSPAGRRKEGPRKDEVLSWVERITALNAEARASLLNPSS
jgi:hypothetical protein